MRTFEAIVENGAIRPLEAVSLRDGEHVFVSVMEDEESENFLNTLAAEQGVREPTELNSSSRVQGIIDDEFLKILDDHRSSQSAAR